MYNSGEMCNHPANVVQRAGVIVLLLVDKRQVLVLRPDEVGLVRTTKRHIKFDTTQL